MRQSQFLLDGEAVLLDLRGISDFDGLMSHKHDDEVQLYAFDVLALDGEDLRKLPPHFARPTCSACWRAAPTAST